jgi:hypothetical protein
MAWKCTAESRYEWMTYALLLFILLNPLIWVYFYLTVFVLMLADVCRHDARRQTRRRTTLDAFRS